MIDYEIRVDGEVTGFIELPYGLSQKERDVSRKNIAMVMGLPVHYIRLKRRPEMLRKEENAIVKTLYMIANDQRADLVQRRQAAKYARDLAERKTKLGLRIVE